MYSNKNECRIACVIVTFNRKALLKRCLDAVCNQTFKPAAVYITDNASTDGTMDAVKEWGYYECEKNGILFKYILNKKNEGGAGGFYLGMKTAFESGGFDGLWVMDDDGCADKDCLARQVQCLIDEKKDYISALLLSDEDRTTCPYGLTPKSYTEMCKLRNDKGLIEGLAFPFNAILYSAKLIRKIGYPKKEMFIWGDEVNYHSRAIKAGMKPVAVANAIHYHPIKKGQKFTKMWGKYNIMVTDSDWKLYCYIRNNVYNWRFDNLWLIKSPKRISVLLFTYIYYYSKIKHNSKTRLLLDAVFSGIFGRFSGLKKYMKA